MAMLVSLTSTALARQWPPPVYARLALQLRDSADLGSDDAVFKVYEQLVADLPLNPLLMDYIATLSSDQHAILWFPVLLRRFAEQDWRERSPKSRALIAYLARSSADWELPAEHEGLAEGPAASLAESTRLLLTQAAEGAPEPRLLMEYLARGRLLAQLAELPTWLPSVEPLLSALGPPFVSMFGRGATEPPKSVAAEEPDGAAPLLVTPSRSMRLLWLEWLLSTSQSLAFANIKPQLDILWTGDRVPTVSYELCVTAFDVYAAKPEPYTLAFILKGLPVILQQLAQDTPNVLDGVLARVFTTMDKAVAEAMDAHNPSVRVDFGSVCIDMGLCDPIVLHALHRSHVPHQYAQPTFDELSRHWNLDDFVNTMPPQQAPLANDIVRAAQGALSGQRPLERHALARLCAALYKNRQAADQLFVHAPVRDFLQAVVEHADAASLLWEEDGGDGLVYSDLGTFFATATMISHRYNIELPQHSWTREYLTTSLFTSVSELTPEQSQLLGLWVKGLFSGSGSGIGDELLRPFRDLVVVLPALIRQAVLAYRSAVIDRETLKSGLDYFVHPFSIALLAPLVFRVLEYDLFEGLHQGTTLEIAYFYLNMVLHKSTSEVFIAKAAILEIAEKMLVDLHPVGASVAATQRLTPAFTELVNHLITQIGSSEAKRAKPPPESSLTEAVKKATVRLADWQARPQGVPALPTSVVSCQAKLALGIDRVRDTIERASAGSPDTLLALLVADALWSQQVEPRLLDAPGDLRLSQSARSASVKFEALAAEQAAQHNRLIAELKEQVRSLPPPVEESAVPVKEEQSTAQQDISMDLQPHVPDSEPIKVEPEPEPVALPSDSRDDEFMMDDFSGDFVNSQPMNLADLDSAMDFGWDS